MRKMEARTGIEPVIELLQSPALPLGYPASGSADCIRPQIKVNCHTHIGRPGSGEVELVPPEITHPNAFVLSKDRSAQKFPGA